MELSWIDTQYNEMIHLLELWANINSYSHNYLGIEKLINQLKEAFQRLEPDQIAILPFDKNKGLFLKKRESAPIQIYFGGHLDTVYPPECHFQKVAYVDGQTLNGPGVTDMKGGIVVLLKALEAFEKSEEAKNIGWEIFLNSDEELGSPFSTPFIQDCAKRCDLALIFEPCLSDGALVSKRTGSANYLAVSHGVSCHVGRNPEAGENAIVKLCKWIIECQQLKHECTINIGVIKGGVASNIVPDRAECRINIRTDDTQSIEKKLLDSAQRNGIKLEKMTMRPPKPLTEGMLQVLEELKSCSVDLGISLKWRETGGVCDGNIFAQFGVVAIDSLGVLGDKIHTEEETIFLPSLIEKAKLTATFLGRIARKEFAIPRKKT